MHRLQVERKVEAVVSNVANKATEVIAQSLEGLERKLTGEGTLALVQGSSVRTHCYTLSHATTVLIQSTLIPARAQLFTARIPLPT
jgi:methylthioribose-1-phosphate isomerase